MHLEIKPAEKLTGEISIPGDKSISHRAIMLSSLADGNTIIENLLESEDCVHTIDCMRSMGIDINQTAAPGKNEKTAYLIKGKGLYGLDDPKKVLYVGNSGTTIRLLLGILAGQNFHVMITGDESIKRRPMMRVVEPLRKMGAVIHGRENGAYAPIEIKGGNLSGIEYSMNVASAQVKSCIMMAALFAKSDTKIIEPGPSRDHTEKLFDHFGILYRKVDDEITVKGENTFFAGKNGDAERGYINIPGDISSAAFFIVAALIVPNSKIIIKNVGLNPTRTGIIDILHRMGAKIEITNEAVLSGEIRGDISVESSKLHGIEIGGSVIPRIIDEIPVIAVAASLSDGETKISNAGELRVKESDRIKTMAEQLSKIGAQITETEDGMTIEGVSSLKGGTCFSEGDHRVAMSLAIAGLSAKNETIIENTDCIETSFPGFEKVLKGLGHY